jgi:hypothetical protein
MPTNRFLRLVAYAWAAPNTVFGFVAGLVMLCLGGRLRWVAGTAEFGGGWLGRFFARLPARWRFGAITIGHVILGPSQADLRACRGHEHVHVRQYERWGPFFLPAYALSSAWQILRGRRGYRDNFFERQAYGTEPAQEPRLGPPVSESPPVSEGQAAAWPIRQQRTDLQNLLTGVTDANLHEEARVGEPRGREDW